MQHKTGLFSEKCDARLYDRWRMRSGTYVDIPTCTYYFIYLPNKK